MRGGNDNPGKREGVDPDRIDLGGHRTGGTMVMVVGAATDRDRAIFLLGPVAHAAHSGGDDMYCNVDDHKETALRSSGATADTARGLR